MNGKLFLPLLIAAILLGTPVHPPKLRNPLNERCEVAHRLYLLAYVYEVEAPSAARKHVSAAEEELYRCDNIDEELKSRIESLKFHLEP